MRSVLHIIGLCLALAGCNSQSDAADANGASASATRAGAGRSSRGSPEFKVVALPDPSFGGAPATFVAVPAGWQISGQMQTNPCVSMPSPAWSASSPDGQNGLDVLPIVAWRWGPSARFGRGCDPLSGAPPGAMEFLKLFAAKLPGRVRIVGDMPVAESLRGREQNFTAGADRSNANTPPPLRTKNFGDVAAARAVDDSGHEFRLRGWEECRQGSQGGSCFVQVDVLRAAKGRLDALTAQFDDHNLMQDVVNAQWQQAYMNRQQRIGSNQMQQLAANAQAGSDMLHQQFLDSSARLRREHEAGMEQIQQQGQHAIASDRATTNAMTTAASDWRDYAADQQTVSGVNGTYKTSSQYTNVWSSPYGPPLSNGRTFGSTDNTDPNSATDNTFTQDRRVHGNGQPY